MADWIEKKKIKQFFLISNCEAQARVRQGEARDGPKGKRPYSLNPCLELSLNLVAKCLILLK